MVWRHDRSSHAVRPERRTTARQPFLLPLIALTLVYVHASLPMLRAMHLATRESAATRGVSCDCGPIAGHPARNAPRHGLPASHDESRCTICQLLATVQRHAFAPPTFDELRLDLAPTPPAEPPLPIWSADVTENALARGPPQAA